MMILCYVLWCVNICNFFFFFQAEDGIRDLTVTGVQTCALPISTVLLNIFNPGNPPWRPFIFPCNIPVQTVWISKIRTHMNAGRRGSRDRNTVIVSCGKPALQSSQLDDYKSDVVVKQSNATADFGSGLHFCRAAQADPKSAVALDCFTTTSLL